jgi:hypothetical protein
MDNLWRCSVVGGLSILGFVAGCVVDVAPTDEPGPHLSEVHQQIGGYDEEANGRFIVGEVFETAAYMPAGAPYYFNVGTTGTRAGSKVSEKIMFTGGASLKPSPANPNLVGLILSSGDVHLKITSVRPDGAITHYGLEVQHGTGPFTRACDDAIPLFGVVTRTGEHQPSPSAADPRITFACKDGGGAKCARFGYPAGLPGSEFWGVHQACVQMLRAEYCGDGVAATRIGTSIAYYDDAGVYQVPPGTQLPIMTAANWPPGVDEYYFEAAFQPGHKPAVCSARARWPLLTDSCIAALPDCGETVDDLIDPRGAVLFVASKYNQLRLDRWGSNQGDGPDRVSTVRGYFNNDSNNFKAPWDGYAHGGTNGVLLRVRPTSVPLDRLTAVSLFRGDMNNTTFPPSDTFLARSDDPQYTLTTDFADLGQEGYVYKYSSDVPDPQTLRFYRHNTTGDRTATTREPGEMASDGYLPYPNFADSLIGYIAGIPGL